MTLGFGARDVLVVLRRVAGVLLALELVYLLVGNLLVRSTLIKGAISDAEGFRLDYGSAYTLWPGHVKLRDFSLRVEDYNVQFEISIAKATIDIDLAQLPFKKFRATRVDAEGTRFRMRHKLIAVGQDAERVAAYPPIEGFANPPYYVGIRSAPIPDAEYDLWQVQIENVTAHATELWVLEYRFQGQALARGSFVVRPGRWVQVLPAELTLERGKLTLGQHLVAAQVQGRIDCQVPDMDVQAIEGKAVFREISTHVKLDARGGQLDFLQAYLARLGSARYAGNAAFRIDLAVKAGVVQPGGQLDVTATPLIIRHEYAELAGDVMVHAGRTADAADTLSLALSAPRLVATHEGRAGPVIEGLSGGLLLHAVDLGGELSIGKGQLELAKWNAPDLGWFRVPGAELSGSGSGQLSLERESSGKLDARSRLSLRRARLERGPLRLASDVDVRVDAGTGPGDDITLRTFELDLTRALVANGAKSTKPFALGVRGKGLHVTPETKRLRGDLQVRVSSAEALLPLVTSEMLSELSQTALGLSAVRGRAHVDLEGDRLAVSRIHAESGSVSLRGHVEKQRAGRQPTGALLFSSGPLNVGVKLGAGDTEVSPFVGDDWLAPGS